MKRFNTPWAHWVGLSILVMLGGFSLHALISLNLWFGSIMVVLSALAVPMVVQAWFSGSGRFEKQESQQANHTVAANQAIDQEKTTIKTLRTLIQAHSEKEILESVLQAGMDLMSNNGASFIPFDEWGQSLPALFMGNVPGEALQTWAQRLSSPETRQACKNCAQLHGTSSCILLSSAALLDTQVECFPLECAGREVGVLNFYHNHPYANRLSEHSLFDEILEAAGKALENIKIRNQEITALRFLHTNTSSQSDLAALLNGVLDNVQMALDVDFAILYIPGGVPGQINQIPQTLVRKKGSVNSAVSLPDEPFMEGIWKSVLDSGQTLSLENVLINKVEKWKALMAVPLAWRGEQASGVLLLGSNNSQLLGQRYQALLETLAGQAALLIQNAQLVVQVEYQAVVDERTRLAREIHDGLAQTLAFLKIQAAQMQNFLARGETEKLTNTLQANYRTLSDAYIDARQAIDNLRRAPTDNLGDWINQVASDFEQINGQKISVMIESTTSEYPVNIQAQLIRIVQEALSNVRKHSGATEINILGVQNPDSYLIEIQDNGKGFSPQDANGDGASHYGLRGMRERSESIGADFQITSQPGLGTRVSVRVPLSLKEKL